MSLYDTDVHIPQLIELLIKDYREGDGDKLEIDKKMLSKISEELKTTFNLTEETFKNKNKELDQKNLEKLKDVISEGKKIIDVFMDIEDIKKSYLEELGELSEDKWETIFAKAVKHIKNTENNGEV